MKNSVQISQENKKDNLQDYKSFDNFQQSNQQLTECLNKIITFEPKKYTLPNKVYKETKINLISDDFIPKFKIDPSVCKKIIYNLNQQKNKNFYIFGSQFKDNSEQSKYIINLDEISYDTEESFENIYYQNLMYPMNACTINNKKHINLQHHHLDKMEQQFKQVIKGLQNFQAFENSDQIDDIDQKSQQPIKGIDMIYLNNFRFFLMFENNQENQDQQIQLNSYVYFPKLDFNLIKIQQPLKLVSTPLSIFLAKKQQISSSEKKRKYNRKFGFLTLDQNQRILPFMASDPLSIQVPLIGVWIYNINLKSKDVMDQKYLIWTCLTEFVKNQQIAQKFTYDSQSKTFLLTLFNPEESPQFYEVQINGIKDTSLNLESQIKWIMLRNSQLISQQIFISKIFQLNFKDSLIINQLENDGCLLGNMVSQNQTIQNEREQEENQTQQPILPVNNSEQINSLQQDFQFNQTFTQNQSLNNSEISQQKFIKDLKLSTVAEKLLLHQQEQLNFLQNQVISLQQQLFQQSQMQQQINQYYQHPQNNIMQTPVQNCFNQSPFQNNNLLQNCYTQFYPVNMCNQQNIPLINQQNMQNNLYSNIQQQFIETQKNQNYFGNIFQQQQNLNNLQTLRTPQNFKKQQSDQSNYEQSSKQSNIYSNLSGSDNLFHELDNDSLKNIQQNIGIQFELNKNELKIQNQNEISNQQQIEQNNQHLQQQESIKKQVQENDKQYLKNIENDINIYKKQENQKQIIQNYDLKNDIKNQKFQNFSIQEDQISFAQNDFSNLEKSEENYQRDLNPNVQNKIKLEIIQNLNEFQEKIKQQNNQFSFQNQINETEETLNSDSIQNYQLKVDFLLSSVKKENIQDQQFKFKSKDNKENIYLNSNKQAQSKVGYQDLQESFKIPTIKYRVRNYESESEEEEEIKQIENKYRRSPRN